MASAGRRLPEPAFPTRRSTRWRWQVDNECLPQIMDGDGAARLPGHRCFLPYNRAHGSCFRCLTLRVVAPLPIAAPLYAPRARGPLRTQRGAGSRGRRRMNSPDYGLWVLVIINSAVFIIFAFSFARPRTKRDWRSFGAFSAFLVALFAEMYGFPLTIYLLSGWLQSRYPGVNWLSHDAGHLLEMLFGWRGNPHFGPFHLLSFIFIGGGFWLLAAAWSVLYAAQRENKLATTGPYARIRH